jgi:thioredoxin-dependent peroxiredoxin
MATVKFKGNPVNTVGSLPAVGAAAPAFSATAGDLSEKKLADYKGKVVVLAAVPSLDTGVCDKETRKFNEEASKLGDGVKVVCISKDLPFAQGRWCGAAGVKNVETLSAFRDGSFGKAYGVEISDGPLKGLLTRAVVVVGKDGKVAYTELVPEITTEPNYEAALGAAKKAAG